MFRMTKYLSLWSGGKWPPIYLAFLYCRFLSHSSSLKMRGLSSFSLSSFCCFKSWKNLCSAFTVALSLVSSPASNNDQSYHDKHQTDLPFSTFRYPLSSSSYSLPLTSACPPSSGWTGSSPSWSPAPTWWPL